MTVNILGTEYIIKYVDFKEEPAFEKQSICAYCDSYQKKIVCCNIKTYPGWEDEPEATRENCRKETLRHEIIHTFLSESGLDESTFRAQIGWAKNEEMIQWFAIQAPKIFKAFEELRIMRGVVCK